MYVEVVIGGYGDVFIIGVCCVLLVRGDILVGGFIIIVFLIDRVLISVYYNFFFFYNKFVGVFVIILFLF